MSLHRDMYDTTLFLRHHSFDHSQSLILWHISRVDYWMRYDRTNNTIFGKRDHEIPSSFPLIKLWYSSIKDKMTPFGVILDSYVGHSRAKILFPGFRNGKNEFICGPYCSSETVHVPFYNVKHCIKWPLCGSFYTWISESQSQTNRRFEANSNHRKASILWFPFRILRNFVPRKRIRSEEDIPEGIGEGNSKRYSTMRNRRFRMLEYLWEGWFKI